MESEITATEAARSFSDIANRVLYRGEEFVVRRGGETICRIVPAAPRRCSLASLASALRDIPQPDPGYWDDLEEIIANQPVAPERVW